MSLEHRLFLLVSILMTSCSVKPERVSEAEDPARNRYEGYSLASQNCSSSFEYPAEEPGQEEVSLLPLDGITMEEIEKQLTGEGAKGWIHAAIPAYNTWVWTIRQASFFQNYQFPLAFKDPKVAEIMKTLHRHDAITIKGEIIKNSAVHKHIMVTEVIVNKRYESKAFKPNHTRDLSLPTELEEGDSAIVKVHSVDHDGKSLTVEYKDMVIQVVVDDGSLTKHLYRNDKIKIHYTSDVREHRPLHLILDETVATPIEMIDTIVESHRREAIVEGCLVLFPQSPQINRNIFALMEIGEAGLMRTWTLANFEMDENHRLPIFAAITKKLQQEWDKEVGQAVNYRNKMLNSGIRVRAKGTLNIIAPNQANPQILLASPDDITLSSSSSSSALTGGK